MSSLRSSVAFRKTRLAVNSVAIKPPMERNDTSDKSWRKHVGKKARATNSVEDEVLKPPLPVSSSALNAANTNYSRQKWYNSK